MIGQKEGYHFAVVPVRVRILLQFGFGFGFLFGQGEMLQYNFF
jgi:hypothetical protein